MNLTEGVTQLITLLCVAGAASLVVLVFAVQVVAPWAAKLRD